ncbi:peroxisomal membrane protein 11B [Cyprinodon tularosa]|uniref:peroxisomal membrane protein 11B n=1 Tax=Cyprinodon tularosa TaxID=77115 RepID=UPI0018E2571F|nr:peroxisomal membrane protein 11B [Cyprinodon tularosa]
MDSWVRFNSQSQAKEKVFRAAQYSCMLLGSTLTKSRAASDLQRIVSDLEAHMSLTRKLLRLGNSVEALQAAKRAIHLSDGVLRLCITIAHLNRAMYFACDNVLWAGKTGIISKLDHHKWSQRSFRYYLFALILNVTRNVYEVCLLLDGEDRCRSTKSSSPSDVLPDDRLSSSSAVPATSPPALMFARLCRLMGQVGAVLYNNPPLLLDLLKNSCDIFIPLDKLGLYRTGPAFVGTCGLLSSVLSIVTMLHPWLKLKP